MTENRRIALNIIATYGRSLYALVCGLFTGRWVLMSLGETDYGLYGVVGGLTVFITFLVSLLSGAVGRFYAFSVGAAKVQADGLETCRKWFNTALLIHTVLPLVVMLIGYPICEYGLRHAWLNIPADRVEACVWVFRFVCITSFVGMVSVPFNAMYTAKQYIAELTIYSFVTTTVNVGFLYYMVSHPGVWLAKYALWSCVLSLLPQLIIATRAVYLFPECRFNRVYLWDWHRICELFAFAGWQFFGNFGYMIRTQGFAILINKCFTPAHNATIAIANTVAGHTNTLTASMNGAFYPAITNACGAEEQTKMLNLMYRSCKLGVLACLLFAIPLILEMNYLLVLWLKKVPISLVEIAILTLITLVVDESTRGVGIAVTAEGRIKTYYVLLGSLNIASLPICWAWICLGGNFISVFIVLLTLRIVANCWAVLIAHETVGVSFFRWLREVVIPISGVACASFLIGFSIKVFFGESSFLRLVSVIFGSVISFLILTTRFVLMCDERQFLASRFLRIFKG